MDNGNGNGSRHQHLQRVETIVTHPNFSIKLSTVPKTVPIFTYSLGHVRTDHGTGREFFAPYLRHQDIPAAIEALQKMWAANEETLIAARKGE